jgi:hypothetical protein
MGLAVLVGVPLIALIPAVYAAKHPADHVAPKHAGGDPAPKTTGHDPNVSPLVRAAGVQTVELLNEQSQAIRRNELYVQRRDKFNQILLRLEQKVPQNPQQAALIQQQIRLYSFGVSHYNLTIALSRLHLLDTLPMKIDRVYHNLNVLSMLAPNNPRVASFVALAQQRQLSAFAQLLSIVNQEVASQVTPGP